MKLKQTTLKNGLRIVTTKMAEMHSLTAVIGIGTGSRYEEFDKNGGVSHFLEHLLFKGSEKYPSAQAVAETIDSVGGSNNAYTTVDSTYFYVKLPSKDGKLALDILADMVKNPLLESIEIDRERSVVIEEMNLYRDDPAQFVFTLFPRLIFPENPLGCDVLGSEDVINNISVEEIRDYMSKYYVPENIVVSVAGDVNHDEVVAQISGLMGDMKSGVAIGKVTPSATISSNLAAIKDKDTAQVHLVIGSRGYSYNDENSKRAKVLAAVLGMGMSSRLFTNVRERQGLAYNVFADHLQFTDTGMFTVYAGVSTEKANQAVESILKELQRISRDLVGETELAKSKRQLIAALEMSMESNSAVADRFANQLLLLGRVKPLEETVSEINSITAEEVREVAIEMLAPKALRMAVIAPNPERIAECFEELIKKEEK